MGDIHIRDHPPRPSKRAERRELARTRRRDGKNKQRPSARTEKDEVAKSTSGKIRNPYAFAKLEERIFGLEAELATIRETLLNQTQWREPASMKELGRQQKGLETELNVLMEQWENW